MIRCGTKMNCLIFRYKNDRNNNKVSKRLHRHHMLGIFICDSRSVQCELPLFIDKTILNKLNQK